MSMERDMKLGMLTKKQDRMKEIVERANSLVVNVHMESNPHIPIDRVNSKRLLVNTKDLDKLVTEIQTLRDEIRDLDEDLGIDE